MGKPGGSAGMMLSGGIHAIELVLLLLLVFVVAFAALARKLQTPYPIVLVIAGLLLSFIPGIPKISLNPDVVFLVVLPPLLYSAAWLTSWREFKFNLVSIRMLAFGLVGFTVLGVAGAARWVFPGFDWRLGFVPGAVIATTDAIAATSIAKRVGLRQRIVDILESESLVNDATGLLALEFGVAMVVSGQTPAAGEGFLRLTAGAVGHHSEEEEARKAMIEAALARLEEARKKAGGEFAGIYEDLEQRYKHRLANLTGQDNEEIGANPAKYARYFALTRELLRAERRTAVKLRNEGRINDEVLRKLEHELDLSEARLSLM
jgi:Sodium/hydrogen exchanger family